MSPLDHLRIEMHIPRRRLAWSGLRSYRVRRTDHVHDWIRLERLTISDKSGDTAGRERLVGGSCEPTLLAGVVNPIGRRTRRSERGVALVAPAFFAEEFDEPTTHVLGLLMAGVGSLHAYQRLVRHFPDRDDQSSTDRQLGA
jgi:hypothetical protein